MRTTAIMCALVLLGACGDRGAENETGPLLTTSSGTTSDGSGDDGPELFDAGDSATAGSGPGDGSACNCAPKSDKIYLLSDSAELWLYSPESDTFTMLGAFDCGVAPTTFSMGVARDGKAWIMFRPTGDVFTVDVNDANNCTDPGYLPDQLGYRYFGMAFSSNSVADPCDDLYLHSFDDVEWSEGAGVGLLARLSEADMSLFPISPIDYNGGELTGTGDGRLFAFAGVPEAKLIEYDKVTGDVVQTIPLPGLELTYAFAFAAWGGDFYFFTESGGIGSQSKVSKLDFDGSDGNGMALTTINTSAPLRVVGAGVSTCAPYTPPG